jgi:hypothetical protein
MRWTVLFVSLILVAGFADETAACVCSSTSPCAAYGRADAVFIGDVVDVRDTGKDGLAAVQLRVVQSGKGAPSAGQLVTVEAPEGTSCSLGFGDGQRWMIFASSGSDGRRTDPCQGSFQLSPAARMPELPARGGTVNGWLGRSGRVGGPPQGQPGVPVWTDTSIGRIATRTGDDGVFRLAGVPSGRWTVRFDVGPDLAAETEIDLGPTDDCFGVHASVRPAGGLSGSVVDESGAPVVGAPITAILATDTEGIYEFEGETDDAGQFLIRALDPGPYLVQVGIDGAATGQVPYRPLFYQAARVRSAAKAVEVGGSTVHLEPIVMRTALPTVTLAVEVVCRDGSRPPKAFVTADRLDGEGRREYSPVQQGDGPRTVRVLAGHRYTVQGMVPVQRKKPDGTTAAAMIETTSLEVDAYVQHGLLRVRVDLQGCNAPGGIGVGPR